MKVVFAGGGTGGHFYTSVSNIWKFKKNNINYFFFVLDKGIKRNIMRPFNIQFEETKKFFYNITVVNV